jgi:hypothetical protein
MRKHRHRRRHPFTPARSTQHGESVPDWKFQKEREPFVGFCADFFFFFFFFGRSKIDPFFSSSSYIFFTFLLYTTVSLMPNHFFNYFTTLHRRRKHPFQRINTHRGSPVVGNAFFVYLTRIGIDSDAAAWILTTGRR